MGPIPDSYRLIDGMLRAGEYPGTHRESATREKLTKFLDAGHLRRTKTSPATLLGLAAGEGHIRIGETTGWVEGCEVVKTVHTVRISRDPDSDWGASVPDLPGCVATGKTMAVTIENIEAQWRKEPEWEPSVIEMAGAKSLMPEVYV